MVRKGKHTKLIAVARIVVTSDIGEHPAGNIANWWEKSVLDIDAGVQLYISKKFDAAWLCSLSLNLLP